MSELCTCLPPIYSSVARIVKEVIIVTEVKIVEELKTVKEVKIVKKVKIQGVPKKLPF